MTARKQSASPIRTRCIQFIETLRRYGYDYQIPLDKAKEIFQRSLGFLDRTTIKAYFGSQPGHSVRKMQKIARYASGTISFKAIELSQEIQPKKGYLELLGLATIEKKGHVWFLKLNGVSIVAQMSPQHYEGSKSSIEEISLSHLSLRGEAEGVREPPLEENSAEGSLTKENKTNNNIQGEREKSGEKSNLSPFIKGEQKPPYEDCVQACQKGRG